jgi:hypothetical protein
MGHTYTGISPYLLNYGREYSQEMRNSNPPRVKRVKNMMIILDTLDMQAHGRNDVKPSVGRVVTSHRFE